MSGMNLADIRTYFYHYTLLAGVTGEEINYYEWPMILARDFNEYFSLLEAEILIFFLKHKFVLKTIRGRINPTTKDGIAIDAYIILVIKFLLYLRYQIIKCYRFEYDSTKNQFLSFPVFISILRSLTSSARRISTHYSAQISPFIYLTFNRSRQRPYQVI